MNDNNRPIVVGTRVHCVLHYRGRGTVFRVEEGQRSEFRRVTVIITAGDETPGREPHSGTRNFALGSHLAVRRVVLSHLNLRHVGAMFHSEA